MRFLWLFAFALASPASANDGCHDLWFTRNLVMDRAGYCFGSALGQAVFDNDGCIGGSVFLDTEADRLAKQLRALESGYGCSVNTSAQRLDLDDASIRRRLNDLPIRDEFGSGCLGWEAPATPLYSGHGAGSEVIGMIEPGDFVSFQHVGVGGWSYVTARTSDWVLKSGGWLPEGMDEAACRAWAG